MAATLFDASARGTGGRAVEIPAGPVTLQGDLDIPEGAAGVVLFAHGTGSSRHSPRNRYVATVLREAGLGTLLMDLLTTEEEAVDLRTRHLRFDVILLTERLQAAVEWLAGHPRTRGLPVGCFGASTGAAAALAAAAARPDLIRAVVSRGGRPDLAGPMLPRVQAPTLLIVGSLDLPVLDMNRDALALLECEKELAVVPGASHLFEEPGTLEEVARLAAMWFVRCLTGGRDAPRA
ncbi:MAG: dienelactone hydrolase family protein [Armatimonadetes bacterium]|nr:dienelactone hydrolase family protein [Armatimonadota bacterium]